MSTESESFERLQSSDWTMSVEAEKSGIYDELVDAASSAYAALPVAKWDRDQNLNFLVSEFHGEPELYDDLFEDEAFEVAFDQHIKEVLPESRLYADANEFDKRQILRALRGDETWLYGLETTTDGMIEGLTAIRRVRLDLMSRYVLSGLLGDKLLEESQDVRNAMEPLGGIAIDRAILAGGAAIAGRSRRATRGAYGRLSASYVTLTDQPLQYQTTIESNSRHGDFETYRRMRPLRAVRTTLDIRRDHHFMPVAGDTERARMYHANEAPLVRALLLHAVLRAGMNADALRSELLLRIPQASTVVESSWGETMTSQPGVLRYQLAHPDELYEDEPLMRALVDPGGSKDQLELYSTREGVLFKNIDEDGNTSSSMEVPNTELIDYILTAVQGIGGEPSKRAMIEVIQALEAEDAV